MTKAAARAALLMVAEDKGDEPAGKESKRKVAGKGSKAAGGGKGASKGSKAAGGGKGGGEGRGKKRGHGADGGDDAGNDKATEVPIKAKVDELIQKAGLVKKAYLNTTTSYSTITALLRGVTCTHWTEECLGAQNVKAMYDTYEVLQTNVCELDTRFILSDVKTMKAQYGVESLAVYFEKLLLAQQLIDVLDKTCDKVILLHKDVNSDD